MITNLLLKLANSTPPIGGSSLAAILLDRGNIIAKGVNTRKTHPLQARYGKYPYLHAEVACIADLLRRRIKLGEIPWNQLEMKVLRLTTGRNVGLAKPCDGCMAALRAFGIRKVEWSTSDPQLWQSYYF